MIGKVVECKLFDGCYISETNRTKNLTKEKYAS